MKKSSLVYTLAVFAISLAQAIAATAPTITPAAPSSVVYSSGLKVTVTAKSTSSGALTYSLKAGAPTGTSIVASTGVVTIGGITSAGTPITVLVTQAASGSYAAVTTAVTAGTITVTAATPTITPNAAQSVAYSNGAKATVKATSPSTGALTYTLGTGYPAGTTIVASTGVVTIGGTGTINVLAIQAAAGNYAAVTTPVPAGTITVTAGTPTITPATAKTVSYSPSMTTVNVVPTSPSTGAFTYSLASGAPSGSSVDSSGNVTIGGAGSITVKVTQAAAGNYAAVTTPTNAGIITVNKGNPAITPTTSQSIIYSTNATVTVTATSTSTGALTYSLRTGAPTGTSIVASTGVVTIGGITTQQINIGVLVTQAANSNYNAITNAILAGTITVNPASPTITPNTAQDVVYSKGVTATVKATSTSSGAFTYSLGTGFPAGTTIAASTGVVTIGGVGTIRVLATQAAAGNYTAVTPAVFVGTINVESAGQPKITPAAYKTVTYITNMATVNVVPTSPSTGAFTYSLASGAPSGSSVDSSGNVTIGGAGSITVKVTQAAAGNYAAVTTPTNAGIITVNKGNPAITPTTSQSIIYSTNATVTVTATSTSTGALTYSLRTGAPTGTSIVASTGVVTIGGITTQQINIGVLVTQAANSNYNAITNAILAGTITVNPASPTITPNTAQDVVYSKGVTATVKATSTSSGAFTYSLGTGFPAGTTIAASTGVVTIGGVGTIRVLATQAAAGNYTAVTPAVFVGTINVESAGQPKITPAAYKTVTYITNMATVNVVPTSPSTGAFTYSLQTGYPAGSSVDQIGNVTIGGAGTITVLVTQAASDSYAAITTAVTAGTITVTAATPTITPNAAQSVAYSNGAKATVKATSPSTGALTYTLGTGYPAGTTIVASTGVVTIGGIGTINVNATQAATGNYVAVATAVPAGTITVTGMTPNITQHATQTVAYSANMPNVATAVTSSSAGTLTYSLAPGAPTGTTINANTGDVHIGGAGQITVLVIQAAAGNYAAVITPVTAGVINVNVGPQTITFPSLNLPAGSVAMGSSFIITQPTASSGLTVTVMPIGPATYNNGLVTITGTGTVTLTATQTGNTNYSAATPVSHSFSINSAGGNLYSFSPLN